MTRPPLLAIVDQLRAELAELDRAALTWFVALFSAPEVSPRVILARMSVACLEDHCHECIGLAESGRPCICAHHDEAALGRFTEGRTMPEIRIEQGSDGVVHRLEEVGFEDRWPPWASEEVAIELDNENTGTPEDRAKVIVERAVAAGYPRVTPV